MDISMDVNMTPARLSRVVMMMSGSDRITPEIEYLANTIYVEYLRTSHTACDLMSVFEKYIGVVAETPGFCYLLMYRRRYWDYLAARLKSTPLLSDVMAIEGRYFDNKVIKKLKVSSDNGVLHLSETDGVADLSVAIRDYYLGMSHTNDYLRTYFRKDVKSPTSIVKLSSCDRVGTLSLVSRPASDSVGGTGSSGSTLRGTDGEVMQSVTLVHAASEVEDPELSVMGGQHIVVFSRGAHAHISSVLARDPECKKEKKPTRGKEDNDDSNICGCVRCDPTEVFYYEDLQPEPDTTYTLLCDVGVMQSIFWDTVKCIYARQAFCTVVADGSHQAVIDKLLTLPMLCLHGTSAGAMVYTLAYIATRLPGRERDRKHSTAVAVSVALGYGYTTYGNVGSLRICTKKTMNTCPEVSGRVFFSGSIAAAQHLTYDNVVVNCTSDVFNTTRADTIQWDKSALLMFTGCCEITVDESVFHMARQYAEGSFSPLSDAFLHNPVFKVLSSGVQFDVDLSSMSMWAAPFKGTCGTGVYNTYGK